MRFQKTLCRLGWLVLVLSSVIPFPAHADEWRLLDVARRYDMFWGGVRVGYMAAEIRQNDKGIYRFELRIKSKGLLEWVSKYESTTVATFRLDKGNTIPLSFFSDGYLRGKHSSTRIEYDSKGNILREVIMPPKKTWKHGTVPEQLLRQAGNPLTGAVMSREFIKNFINQGYATGTFNIKIYDGKRLGDYRFSVSGDSKISIKGAEREVYGMHFSRTAIAGFSDSEKTKLKDEPVIEVYFGKDAVLLPLKAEAKIPYGGNAVVLFDRDCASITECGER